MNWLAVDYGDARTGLAGCDEGEILVTPLVPQIEEKSMNKVAAAAAERAAQRGAQGLVCGLPKNLDGTEGPAPPKAAGLPRGWPTPPDCRWCCGTSGAPPCPPRRFWRKTTPLGKNARRGWTRCPPRYC